MMWQKCCSWSPHPAVPAAPDSGSHLREPINNYSSNLSPEPAWGGDTFPHLPSPATLLQWPLRILKVLDIPWMLKPAQSYCWAAARGWMCSRFCLGLNNYLRAAHCCCSGHAGPLIWTGVVPQVTLLMHLPQPLWQWRAGHTLLSLGGAWSAPGIDCPRAGNTACRGLPRGKLQSTCSALLALSVG